MYKLAYAIYRGVYNKYYVNGNQRTALLAMFSLLNTLYYTGTLLVMVIGAELIYFAMSGFKECMMPPIMLFAVSVTTIVINRLHGHMRIIAGSDVYHACSHSMREIKAIIKFKEQNRENGGGRWTALFDACLTNNALLATILMDVASKHGRIKYAELKRAEDPFKLATEIPVLSYHLKGIKQYSKMMEVIATQIKME